MKSKAYERAVVEWLKTRWPPPRFEVKHDFKLPGGRSNAPRQIDAGVFESGALDRS